MTMSGRKKKPFIPGAMYAAQSDDERYEVTVWDMIDGDIVKKRWDATREEADEIEEQYADDPRYSVQIEPLGLA